MSEAAKSSFRSSFRDVGVSINEYAETQLVTPGRLYICACLDDATDEDNEFLRNDTKFKTIVDTDRKHGQSLNTIPIVGGTTSSISMTKFLGITRYRVNLTSKSYVNNIMAQISVWTKCKIAFAMFTFNLNNPALIQPVTDVILARGSTGDSIDVLDMARQQICELFNAVLCHDDVYPLLICGGKLMRDQNLLVVLILLLLDVPVELISTNYVSLVEDLQVDLDQCQNKGEFELGQAMVSARHQWVSAIKNHLDKLYGGVEGYLSQGGVTKQSLNSLQDALLGGSKAR